MITTDGTVGLAERIIDDTCLVFNVFPYVAHATNV